MKAYTVEALVTGHPRDAKTVSVRGASRLQEWEFGKTGYCEGGRKHRCLLTIVSVGRTPRHCICALFYGNILGKNSPFAGPGP